MPALAITLTLDPAIRGFDKSARDVVSFISSLLLGSDQHVRNWFSGFIRGRQKVICSIYCIITWFQKSTSMCLPEQERIV